MNSGAVTTKIKIPATINNNNASDAQINYTVWFSEEEVMVKADLYAYFGTAVSNSYNIETLFFAYLFDDEGAGWNSYIYKMESQIKNQTHNYQSFQEDTYDSFYAGSWFSEHDGMGSINLYLDNLKE